MLAEVTLSQVLQAPQWLRVLQPGQEPVWQQEQASPALQQVQDWL
jgi:hypothetical protein